MTFYSEIPELKAIPEPDEFAAVHRLFDKSLGVYGAWADVTSRHLEIKHNEQLSGAYSKAFKFGQFLEMPELEVENGTRGPLHGRDVARAFAQGYMQQLEPQRLLYSEDLTAEEAITMLEIRYVAKKKKLIEDAFEGSEESWRFVRSRYIAGLGASGLRFMGDTAVGIIDKWSREVFAADTRQQMAFRLGHGAMETCGRQYQSAKNVHLKDQYDLSERLSEEILEFLRDTSENQ